MKRVVPDGMVSPELQEARKIAAAIQRQLENYGGRLDMAGVTVTALSTDTRSRKGGIPGKKQTITFKFDYFYHNDYYIIIAYKPIDFDTFILKFKNNCQL